MFVVRCRVARCLRAGCNRFVKGTSAQKLFFGCAEVPLRELDAARADREEIAASGEAAAAARKMRNSTEAVADVKPVKAIECQEARALTATERNKELEQLKVFDRVLKGVRGRRAASGRTCKALANR